ncbi:hypothetical protein [Cohnella panacarvi]|uniref:hypothetical protein n=1 Tax=Cohnella panacarvi TaxID=400776 RepID=UPI00047B39C8|nr:hypothetical protein [Cohnella panacarvi]
MNKAGSYFLLIIVGAGLLGCGVYFIRTIEDPQGAWRALPFICVGLGCAIFGHGMGETIVRLAMMNNPAAIALMGIELFVLLLMVFAYMFIVGYGTYYRLMFNKEM